MHQQFKEYLKDSKNILILCSQPLDFDSLGSGLILYKYLRKIGKKVSVIFPRKMSREEKEFNAFLPGFSDILDQDIREIFKGEIKYDGIIFLDGGSPTQFFDSDQIGKEPDFSRIKTSVHIDHHLSQVKLGNLIIHDPTLSSTVEVLLTSVIPLDKIDAQMATLAYAGIVGDTGNFKWGFTAKTLVLAGKLLDIGASVQEIFEKTFFSKSPDYFKTLSYVAQKLEFYPKLGTVIFSLPNSLIKKDNLKERDIDLMGDIFTVEIARSIKGYPRGIRLTEESPSRIKLSFRGSNLYNKINMPEVLTKAGGSGGGHFNACGFSFQGELGLVKRKIIQELRKAI